MEMKCLSRDNLDALSKSDLIDLVVELVDPNALSQDRVDGLERRNAFLSRRIHDLERRLGSNSSNGGNPPSSDGLKKPPARKRRTGSLRGKSGRKSGGQHGHEGTTPKQVAAPDEIIDHHPRTCPNCRASPSPENTGDLARRQVFDLPPPPPLFVMEHRVHACRCRACGTKVRADFPEDVKAPARYGDDIASLAAHLQTRHCIPEDRLAQIFSDIHKIRIGPATLANLIARKAHGLRAFAEKVKALLSSSAVPVKHLDETGFRIAGKTRRLHVLRSKSLGHLRLGTGRGDIPSGLAGTVVHDCRPPYLAMETVRHGLCNAHLLRDYRRRSITTRSPGRRT